MAPPRTMVATCQQPKQNIAQKMPVEQQQQQLTAKPRKRNRSKQVNQTQNNKEAPKQTSTLQLEQSPEYENLNAKESATVNRPASIQADASVAQVVPSERVTIKKLQQLQNNNVPIRANEAQNEPINNKRLDKSSIMAKQISTDETDDIDAGIELDGSSYSGSSVKDISEDQMKSASVSPVMAQSNLVNETSTKHAADVSSVEQLTGSLCSMPVRKASATKQELAAIQQVIEADEQLLQQKLRDKQLRKSSKDNHEPEASQHQVYNTNASTTTTNSAPTESDNPSTRTNEQTDLLTSPADESIRTPNKDSTCSSDKSAKARRRFSSQSSQEALDSSLCKVCDQHVYQMERMMAEKSLYHKRCFRCYQCKIQLRVDNYSSHEGQVYCKAHHRQIFQPQVKLDDDDDVDIVAKSSKYASPVRN